MWFKKLKIDRLITTYGKSFEPVRKGEFIQKEGCWDGVWKDQCTVKHLGGGRYLVGYCLNENGNYETLKGQCLINKWMILYPSMIKVVHFK